MTNRANILLTVGIGLLFCASAAGSQEKQPLQYRFHRDAKDIVNPIGSVVPKMTTGKPQGVNLPEFKGRTQFFTQWSTPMVPSGSLHIALDKTDEQGRWGRIYVDSDADGHLNDEEAVMAHRTEQHHAYFGPVKVVLKGQDGPVDYHLNFKFFDYNELNRRLYISSACWYEGWITVAWIQRHCVLIDRNSNGTFNDKARDAHKGDSIKVGAKEDPSVYVGNYIEVGGTLYHPEIARDGASVKLTRAENVEFGTVRFPETITFFMTGGENGLYILKPEKGIVSLPVGRYRILHWCIDRKDDQGRRWDLRGGTPFNGGFFEVNHEKQTPLSIGEPVMSSLTVQETNAGFSLRQSLIGRLGELVRIDRWGPSRDRLRTPKLRIRNKDGSYDRTFTFEYG